MSTRPSLDQRTLSSLIERLLSEPDFAAVNFIGFGQWRGLHFFGQRPVFFWTAVYVDLYLG